MGDVAVVIARSGIDLGDVEAIKCYLAESRITVLSDDLLLSARIEAFNLRNALKVYQKELIRIAERVPRVPALAD